jgi:hypothetical protein
MQTYTKLALVSGVTGGVMAELQGGRFGNGFVTAGANALLAPIPEAASLNAGIQTVVAAVVGGTVSRIGGGKFAYGAITSAFSYAFGAVASQSSDEVTVTGCGSKYGCSTSSWGGEIPDYLLPPSDVALDRAASSALAPLKLKPVGEWVGYVQFCAPVGYIASRPSFLSYQLAKGSIPTVGYSVPFDAVGIFHTHPFIKGANAFNRAQSTFGSRDAGVVYSRGIPNYLKAPIGPIRVLQMTPLGPMPRNVVSP